MWKKKKEYVTVHAPILTPVFSKCLPVHLVRIVSNDHLKLTQLCPVILDNNNVALIACSVCPISSLELSYP